MNEGRGRGESAFVAGEQTPFGGPAVTGNGRQSSDMGGSMTVSYAIEDLR